MSNTSQNRVITPEKIITSANTPSNHRHNLSSMVIAFLNANPEASEEYRQDVYLTYVALNSALKAMEGGTHE